MGLKRICSCSEASVSGAVEFAIDQRSSSLMSGMVMIMKGSMRKEMRQRMKMIYLDTAQIFWPWKAGGGTGGQFSQTLE